MCDTYDHMGVSINGGPPNGWFTRGNPVKMDDLGVPHFRKCPYSDEVVKQLISGGAPSRRLCRLFVPLADPPAHRYHQSSHSVARLPAPPMALAQGCRESWDVPSGIHRKNYWKWPSAVDWPMKHVDFPWLCWFTRGYMGFFPNIYGLFQNIDISYKDLIERFNPNFILKKDISISLYPFCWFLLLPRLVLSYFALSM